MEKLYLTYGKHLVYIAIGIIVEELCTERLSVAYGKIYV